MGNDFVVTVIFCDDVRFEIGGKITLVGIYRGVMGIAPQVAMLPKVVAMVMLSGPRSDVGTKFNIRLKDRDTILISAIVEFDQSLQSVGDHPLDGLDADIAYANIPIELLGFVPHGGERLVVEIDAGAFSFRSDVLAVVRPDRDLFTA